MAQSTKITLDENWVQLNTVEDNYIIQVLGNYDVEIQYSTATPTTDNNMSLSPKDGLTSAMILGTAYGRCKYGGGIVVVSE